MSSGHQEDEHGAPDRGDRDTRPPGVAAPVEQRAEGRSDDGKGRDREQQVEQDLALGGLRRDREEQGPRERDRDEGRAHREDGVDERQPAEGLGLVEQVVDGAPEEPGEASPARRVVHVAMVRVGSSPPDAATMRANRGRGGHQWEFGPTC